MKPILQYVIYRKQSEGFYSLICAEFQKNLLVLVFLLQDTAIIFSRFIDDIKNINQIPQMSFNASRVFYKKSDGTIEVNENVGFEDDEDYSTFVITPQALISIVERWVEAQRKRQNFIIMTLDEDNYVDFIALDTQNDVDEYIQMHYRSESESL